jgi:hypothetical protein
MNPPDQQRRRSALTRRLSSSAALLLLTFTASTTGLTAQTPTTPSTPQNGLTAGSSRETAPPARYTAIAVLFAPGYDFSPTPVDIQVDRWTTDAERDRLLDSLTEQGREKMLTTLQNLPRVGSFKSLQSFPYDIHFARRIANSDGSEQVTLVTDRSIDFYQAANFPGAMDYRFTVIELKVGKDGKGEGKVSVATKISFDKANKTIVLENYNDTPVTLSGLTRQKN